VQQQPSPAEHNAAALQYTAPLSLQALPHIIVERQPTTLTAAGTATATPTPAVAAAARCRCCWLHTPDHAFDASMRLLILHRLILLLLLGQGRLLVLPQPRLLLLLDVAVHVRVYACQQLCVVVQHAALLWLVYGLLQGA
jgi:hypothetical protein